ncbi:response regulator transcription factor [Hyphomonas sp. NPDC076900]|jgi:two-component system OmpR family response regulator|uniref:DNA-binding response regulator n=2 Tax=Hyphomonadaceae TaxID=69657 RepID=A0A062VLC1_9PROT|nr:MULTISPECIES: response regulator transcription factor [unclassified Hyphomonas]KCZ98894.1 DNA-binding response regulator [Hyphomonas polymorpha PS728]
MTLMETSMVETESTASLKVLVIEDDNEMASFIEKVLADAGHKVERVADGASGLARARASEFDALIVDRMLPEKDGLTLLQEFRAAGGTTPALFLSALGDVQNKVQGLRAGAEDYLAKPFAPAELAARVEALGRRQTSAEPPVTVLKAGDLEMNLLTRKVTRAGKKIDLQPREFRLLEYLMRHAGQVVTRTMLLEKVWDYNFDPQTNVIDVHISRLRAKIDKEFAEPLLQTVRGAGYRLQSQG